MWHSYPDTIINEKSIWVPEFLSAPMHGGNIFDIIISFFISDLINSIVK